MKTIQLKEKSTEELIRKSKQLKTYAILGILAGVAVPVQAYTTLLSIKSSIHLS